MNDDNNPSGSTTPPGADPWTQNAQIQASGVNAASNNPHPASWERELISKVAMAAVVEQRRARRWGIFFKSVFLLYLLISFWLLYEAATWSESGVSGGRHSAVINIEGIITSGADASAGKIIHSLRTAFEEPDAAGIIVRINSPGGSPVQAGQIYDEIMRLRELYPDKSVYAVAADVCASGGYYIAAATQEIYADKASIVGSIGVRADGFGFVEAMNKLGIERRLYTAGENKSMLDPFTPEDPVATQHLQTMLSEVHQQFIDAVRNGRGERLKNDPQLFSGLVWSGSSSVDLGLIDGLGSTRYVAEELIGAEELVDYTVRSSWLDQVLTRVGAGLGQTLNQTLLQEPLKLR